MLSADPRIVPEARPVAQLSLAEASELAYFGAKVLHPKTLLPAIDRAIPVRILNTAHPDEPGSLITPTAQAAESSWLGEIDRLQERRHRGHTSSPRAMLLAHGFLARVFEVFGRHHIVRRPRDDLRGLDLGDGGRTPRASMMRSPTSRASARSR